MHQVVVIVSSVEDCLTGTSSSSSTEWDFTFTASTCTWTGVVLLLSPSMTESHDVNISSSTGLQTHSRLLRLPWMSVEWPSSASMTSRLLLWSSSEDELSSSVSENPSMTGVGTNSTSLSWKATRFVGENIRLAVLVDVAVTCRRGKGLLRRMLRVPMGRTYGAVL